MINWKELTPTLNLKQWLVITVLVLGTGFGSYVFTKAFFPRIETIEITQEKVDKNTWIKKTEYLKERDLKRKLQDENRELLNQIETLNEKVDGLTTINVQLNVAVDSLQPDTLLLEGSVRDTVAVFTETYGDSLFKVTSRIGITKNMLYNYLDLEQLRPVRIDIAQINERVLVSSPDIKDLKIQSLTTNKKPRFSKFEIFAGGAVLGSIATLILIIL